MPDEILEQEQEQSAVDIITEMKANTVTKTKYESLQAEHNKLLKALVNGEEVEVEAPEKPNIDELRLELFTEDVQRLNNLQFVEKTLQLRNALIEAGEQDPFVPCGSATAPEESDFATADRVAQVLQECLDYANGDSQVFTAELQRRTMDVNPVGSKARRNR
jgi:hypothetical protein